MAWDGKWLFPLVSVFLSRVTSSFREDINQGSPIILLQLARSPSGKGIRGQKADVAAPFFKGKREKGRGCYVARLKSHAAVFLGQGDSRRNGER